MLGIGGKPSPSPRLLTQDRLGSKGRSREARNKTGFRTSGHRAGAWEPGGCLWNQTR